MPDVNRHDVTRRSALFAISALPLLAQDSRPNTLIVLVDDLRWDSLGCTGHPFVKTPNIDRIAREGVRFDNAFCTTPQDSPSRATLMTGQYVHQHDVRTNSDNSALSLKLKTFPLSQQRSGYETALIGKWSIGNDDSPRPGFDRWVSFKGHGVYVNPQFNIDGRVVPQSGYTTDLLTASAVDFIRKRRGKPFSLILGQKAVHAPLVPAERYKNLYLTDSIRRAPNANDSLEGKPAMRRALGNPPRTPLDDSIRQQLQCLAAVDEGVGKIFAALEETRQLDNTIIVFTSDNGSLWGEHALTDRRVPYDEAIRIPLLIRYPRLVRAGMRLRNFALTTDLAPTLVEISRSSPLSESKGRSLVPLLQGRARGWRSGFIFEYFEDPQTSRIPSWQAVRTDRWKYIRYTKLEGVDEFYDLASDPYEMKNLINDPSAQDALSDSKEELARLWRETF